jgi:hypothetical protein
VSSCGAQIVRLGISSSRALHLDRFDASSIFGDISTVLLKQGGSRPPEI